MREKHQKPRGFETSRSKTFAVSVGELYNAWMDEERRSLLLSGVDITIRGATPEKSMRVTWVDGRSSLDVNFYAKGDRKRQVTAQHGELVGIAERPVFTKSLNRKTMPYLWCFSEKLASLPNP